MPEGTASRERPLVLADPPEDVRGFIENETRNYKFTGYWKVYGDEERSRALFDKFERCTRCYLASWAVEPGWSGSLWPSKPELP